MTMIGEVFLAKPQFYMDMTDRRVYTNNYTCSFTQGICHLKGPGSFGFEMQVAGDFTFTDEYGVERTIIPDDGGLLYANGVSDQSTSRSTGFTNTYDVRLKRDVCYVVEYYGNVTEVRVLNFTDSNVREIRKRWRLSMVNLTQGLRYFTDTFYLHAESKDVNSGFLAIDNLKFLDGFCRTLDPCDYTKRLLYDDTLGYIPSYQNEPLFPSFGQCIPLILEGRFTIECQNCSNYDNITYELMLINQCDETVYFEESSSTELVCTSWNDIKCANLNRGQPELIYKLVVTVVARNYATPNAEVKSSTNLTVHVIKLPLDVNPEIKCQFNTTQPLENGTLSSNMTSLDTMFRVDCTGLHQRFNIYSENITNFYETHEHKILKKVTVSTTKNSLLIPEYIEPVSIQFALPPGNSTVSIVVTNCDNVIYQDDLYMVDLPFGASDEESFYLALAEKLGPCSSIHNLLFKDTFGYMESYSDEPLQPSFGKCTPLMLEGIFEIECQNCENYDNITYEILVRNKCNQTIYYEESSTTTLACSPGNGFDCENLNRGQPFLIYTLVVTVVARRTGTPDQAVKSSTSVDIHLLKLPDTDPAVKCVFNTVGGIGPNNRSSLTTRFKIDCTALHQKYHIYNESFSDFYLNHTHKFHKTVTILFEEKSVVILEYLEPVSRQFVLPPGNSTVSIVVTNCDNVIYQDNFTIFDLPMKLESEAISMQSAIDALDKDGVSGSLMVSILIERYPELLLYDSQMVLEELLLFLLKIDVDTFAQIERKMYILGSIGEEKMKNISTAEKQPEAYNFKTVSVFLKLYYKTLDDLIKLDENVTSQSKENITGKVFEDVTSIINSLKEEPRGGRFDDMTPDTVLLLFDVLDKTCDVAVQNYTDMEEPVTLVVTNITQVTVQKITQDNPRVIKLSIRSNETDEEESFFEVAPMPEMTSRNLTIKMMYLAFDPFSMINTTINVTSPIFTVFMTDEKGQKYGKNFTTPVSYATPIPIIEEQIKTEMSILYNDVDGMVTPVGGNLMFMINFTMAAKETKILDIKLPKNISNIMIYGQANNPMSRDEILLHGFEFPTSLRQIQKYYYKDFDLNKVKENITDYRIHILSNESNIRNGTSQYDMYFGITHNFKDSVVIQELTDIAQECKDNNTEVCTLQFDIQVGSLLCVFWDDSDWSVEGCEGYPPDYEKRIKCQCDHLSSFSSKYSIDDFLVKPVMISIGDDILLFSTFFENPVVVTVVIMVWVIYFFLVYMVRRLDRKDVEQIGVVACADNDVPETYVYLICVMTGWWAQAGTSANVYLNIKGKNGVSSSKRLSTSSRQCFQSGGEDWFVFTTERSLGTLESVTVWHDNAGSSPHWYLNQVYIKDNQTDTAWTFIYNDWVAVDRGTLKQIVATIPLVSQEHLKHKKMYHLYVISTRTLRDGHQWLSIMTKSAQSSFTRVQRLTCGLSLLLTLMLTNIMFYGLPSDDPTEQLEAGVFSFSLRQFIIGIESSLIMFPINLIVLQLFIRIKPKTSKQKRTIKKRNVKKEERSIDPLSNFYLKLYKSNTFAKSGLYTNISNLYQKEQKALKGDEVVAKYLKICRQNMMWNVLKNCKGAGSDHDITRQFTKQSFFSRLNKDHTDTERASSTILIDLHEFDDTKPSHETELNKSVQPEADHLKTSRSDEHESKPRRNEITKIFPWWFIYVSWTVVMVTCLVSSFFVMLYGLKYGYTRSVEWVVSFLTGFLQGVLVEEPLKVIGISAFLALILNKQVEVEEFEQDMELADDEEYLDEVKEQNYNHQPVSEPFTGDFLNNIREKLRLEWLMVTSLVNIILYIFYLIVLLLMVYGHNNNHVAYQNTQTLHHLLVEPINKPTLSEVSNPSDFYNYMKETFIPAAESLLQMDKPENSSTSDHYMLGPYRIRQVRVKPGECHTSLPHQVVTRCQDSYWYSREDTNNYLNSWTNYSGTQDSGPWTYQDSEVLKTLPYMGNHAMYSGGGYVKVFSKNALAEINDLEEKGWIDERTRALFVEGTVYNPNTDIFASVIILFELTPIGIMYPKSEILSTNLHHGSAEMQWILPTCEGLFVIFTFLFVYVEVVSYRKVGKREYFGNSWNYVEIIQIALSFVIIGLFIKRILTVNDILDKYSQNGNNHFTHFYTAFHWDSILKYVMAFLVALVAGKSIKVFSKNARTKLTIVTFAKARPAFLGFLLLFSIASAAYSHLGYLLFGKALFSFRSIQHSFYSNTHALFGNDIGLDLNDHSEFFGPLYLVTFIFFIYYILFQFCLTILNISHIIAKFEVVEQKELDLIIFLKRKICLLFGKK